MPIENALSVYKNIITYITITSVRFWMIAELKSQFVKDCWFGTILNWTQSNGKLQYVQHQTEVKVTFCTSLLFKLVLFCVAHCSYAYLTFGSRSRMLEAFNRYSSQPIFISGHLMRISKYEPPRDIPLGMHLLFYDKNIKTTSQQETFLSVCIYCFMIRISQYARQRYAVLRTASSVKSKPY